MDEDGAGQQSPQNNPPPRNKGGRPKDPMVKARHDMRRELDDMALNDAPTYYGILRDAAKAGDMQAIKILIDRIWPSRRGAEIEFNIPRPKSAADLGNVMDAVIEQVASGILTVDEGERVMEMLLKRAKVFEVVEVMHEIEGLRELVKVQIAEAGAAREEAAKNARELREARLLAIDHGGQGELAAAPPRKFIQRAA